MDKKMTSGQIAKKAGVSQKAVRLDRCIKADRFFS